MADFVLAQIRKRIPLTVYKWIFKAIEVAVRQIFYHNIVTFSEIFEYKSRTFLPTKIVKRKMATEYAEWIALPIQNLKYPKKNMKISGELET